MTQKWESLENRVKRHMLIPNKKKLEWLKAMLDLASGHQLKLRKKLRLIVR